MTPTYIQTQIVAFVKYSDG